MLRKRLIAVVTVRNGLAVQSFGYSRYLPLGKPEALIENLDRWGADEILISCIDRSAVQSGPDFNLLRRVGKLGLSTPLIYGGGIRHAEDAVQAVNLGADRVAVDAMLWDHPLLVESIAREIGSQAIIGSMPVRAKDDCLYWLNYRIGKEVMLNPNKFSQLPLEWVSEVMLTDWSHEGKASGFDSCIVDLFGLKNKALIVFGGLSDSKTIQNVLYRSNVMAAGIGNFLSYKEHAIQQLKQNIVGSPIRPAQFCEEV